MDSEDMWKVGGYLPPGTSKFIGEDDVLSSPNENLCGPMEWMWKNIIDGQRDIPIAMHCFDDSLPGLITRGDRLQTIILPDTIHHGFAGAKQSRLYTLVNDTFSSANYSLQWKLVWPDGKVVDSGKDARSAEPGARLRGRLDLTLPDVAQRTTFTLQVRLSADGQCVSGEDHDIEVWPDKPIPPGALSRRLFLYDPKGTTAEALNASGAKFDKVDSLAAPDGDPAASALIIGENALDAAAAKAAACLTKFVDSGGRVVVLAQTVTIEGLPAKTALDPCEYVSQPYVRLPIHPALEGISSWDLHFWGPPA